ncbi:HlyD family secretion protein [Chachezhania sediminis]|uniref:HlyD family secretion protein n=1 Tax=Chachezhania sediminis TaxID=2599291 RepID=UPI00131D05A0|nr:biotin/lipoyl-binding protein [Chachezhania sediminis]
MLELMLTSFPVIIRIIYLRFRKKPVTLYNVHRAVFVWICLFIALIFTIEYYHPDTHKGLVPYRVVPVVPERGGTVTMIAVKPNQRVNTGDLLFTVDDQREQAAVKVAKTNVDSVQAQLNVADSEVDDAKAQVASAQAAYNNANIAFTTQDRLRQQDSPAFAQNAYDRAKDDLDAQQAVLDSTKSQLETAQLKASQLLPAQLAAAQAELDKANLELSYTRVTSSVSGQIEQITLNVGDRAAEIPLKPSMLIVPDRGPDYPSEIVAGFTQVNATVIHPGMPAEVACRNNINNSMDGTVLPVRIKRIQNVISTGQVAPTGVLLQPSDRPVPGDVLAFMELVYPEQESLLMDGASCLVQAYTTRIGGSLQGTFLGNIIQAWGLEKAAVMRMKVWIMLAIGAGMGGEG